jgi:outer membrane biosynthesis protein TonB
VNVDRAEQTGFGVAVGGHLVLLGALYIGFTSPPPLPMPRQPMEVQLVDEIGLESGAPELSSQPPAPKLGEIEATLEPLPPEPEPAPAPAPPQPKATPTPKVVPQPKAAPPQPKTRPKQKTARPAGRLSGILEGIGDTDSTSRSTKAPAATVTPAVQSSLAAEVRRQIKAHWDGPNGPDVDKIRTVLRISLARDGTATNIEWVETTGVNDTNRGLAQLHRERAIKAVRLASPFKLPAQFYEGWKAINVSFDWRLSQ